MNDERQVKEKRSQIFKDPRWASDVVSQDVRLVSIGINLLELYNGERAIPQNPFYLALQIVDGCYEPLDSHWIRGLFASLRNPHTYDDMTHEVHFQQSNIILSVAGFAHTSPSANLQCLREPPNCSHHSRYLSWHDPGYERYSGYQLHPYFGETDMKQEDIRAELYSTRKINSEDVDHLFFALMVDDVFEPLFENDLCMERDRMGRQIN